jgi:hypothetical protein
MDAMRSIMRTLKLTINEEKTHVCRAPDESFDFLGYTFGTCYSRRNGWRYITVRPSKKKIQAICRRISELTNRRWCLRDVDEQVGQLNQIMVGWARYFCHGPIGQPYRTVTAHACHRLRRWLRQKHKVQGRAFSHYPNEYLHKKLGLVRLRLSDFNVPWANA